MRKKRASARDGERAKKVGNPVVAGADERDLRTRDDDRLAQILEHESEGAGSVSHGVGAMENHEPTSTVSLASARW